MMKYPCKIQLSYAEGNDNPKYMYITETSNNLPEDFMGSWMKRSAVAWFLKFPTPRNTMDSKDILLYLLRMKSFNVYVILV